MSRVIVTSKKLPLLKEFLEETIKDESDAGIGIFYFRDSIPVLEKIIPPFTVDDILNLMPASGYCLMFARSTRATDICLQNCQPILIPSMGTAFVHDGTWSKSDALKFQFLLNNKISYDDYKIISESVVLGHLLDITGPDFLNDLSDGVVVIARKDGYYDCFVHKGFLYAIKIDSFWYYATKFPDNILDLATEAYSLKDGSIVRLYPHKHTYYKGGSFSVHISNKDISAKETPQTL